MSFFRRLSIRGKLLVGFSLTIFILLVLAGYSKFVFDSTNQSFIELNQNYRELRGFLNLEVSNERLTGDVKSYLLTKDPKWEADYNKTLAQLDEALTDLRAIPLSPAEVGALHSFEQVTDQLKGTELLILTTAKEGNTPKATQLFDSRYDSAQEKISILVDGLITSKNTEVESRVATSRNLIDQTQKGALGLLALGIMASLLFAVYFSNFITTAIRRLAVAAEKLASGDLTTRADISTRDEIEALGTSFNVMAANLEESIRKLRLSEDQMSAERDKLSLVLSGIKDAVIAVDLNRDIVIFNKGAELLTGFTEQEVKNKPIESVLRVFDGASEIGPREFCPVRTDSFEGVTFSKSGVLVEGKSGRKSPVNLTTGQIKDGASVNLGAILTLQPALATLTPQPSGETIKAH